ncbi:MAG: MBL fold metallo-hydrolase [Clostridia bacterium]|nr:MBL fold metallo-hydrolase [Clostridia bacterium]
MGHYGIRLKWLSIASFEIDFGTKTIVTDPCITVNECSPCTWENVEKCDFFTLSHGHWDHITDFPVLAEKFPDAPILCGTLTAVPLMRWMNANPMRVFPMDANVELDFGDLKIKSLFGRHIMQPGGIWDTEERMRSREIIGPEPNYLNLNLYGSIEYRNFLFTAANGTKILIWGNTPDEMAMHTFAPLQPDIAILQCSKQAPEKLAALSKALGAKVVIPHHMDLGRTEEEYMPRVEAFRKAYLDAVPDGTFICPKHGEWIEL